MPYTAELLDRLRQALAVADTANDNLVGAYIATPIALLEERQAKRESGGDPPR